MQFELNKLKGRIKEKGYTQEDTARYLNIAPSTFSIKINGTAFFSQDEIYKLATFLQVPNEKYGEYFFKPKV